MHGSEGGEGLPFPTPIISMLAPVVVSYRYVILAISFETFRIFRASFILNTLELTQESKQVRFV